MDGSTVTAIVILRMVERTLAILVGAGAIYLGYRLFVLLPTQTSSGGKIQLPGYSVVLSKVGPGVFFAAFGSVVLYQSFSKPVSLALPNGGFVGAFPELEGRSTATSVSPFQALSEAQALDRVRRALQALNCFERLMERQRVRMRAEDIEEPLRDARIALLSFVWMPDWGTPDELRRWALAREGTIPESLRDLYQGELPACPG